MHIGQKNYKNPDKKKRSTKLQRERIKVAETTNRENERERRGGGEEEGEGLGFRYQLKFAINLQTQMSKIYTVTHKSSSKKSLSLSLSLSLSACRFERRRKERSELRLWGVFVHPLKHIFSIFKQHYMHFLIFFHSRVFPHIFSNTCTKHPFSFWFVLYLQLYPLVENSKQKVCLYMLHIIKLISIAVSKNHIISSIYYICLGKY